jgi:hypothetical protein
VGRQLHCGRLHLGRGGQNRREKTMARHTLKAVTGPPCPGPSRRAAPTPGSGSR